MFVLQKVGFSASVVGFKHRPLPLDSTFIIVRLYFCTNNGPIQRDIVTQFKGEKDHQFYTHDVIKRKKKR